MANFEEDNFYHIYNRTNNRELLFRSPENYSYFLKLYQRFLQPFCRTYSWCLLPNHFHFLLQTRSIEAIFAHLTELDDDSILARQIRSGILPTVHEIISNAFKKLFTAYAMGFNKAYSRSGNLFHRPFKRLLVEGDDQLINTAIYIHTNPDHHRMPVAFDSYKWSSYNQILAQPEYPEASFLLARFGGIDAYKEAHISRAASITCAIEDRELLNR